MKKYEYISSNSNNAKTNVVRGTNFERPPFKWAGSKNRMFNRYLSRGFFPKKEPKVFVDMFAGTGTVGWWIAKNYQNTTIVLNETCDELINMYRMMQKQNFSAFMFEYGKHVKAYANYSNVEDRKKHYYALRDRYALNFQTMNNVEQAAALFYMLQTGFNGIWQTSDNFNNRYASPAGLMTWKPNGDLFNAVRIKNFAEFIDRCVLLSGDFERTGAFTGSDTWFYADPPYRQSHAKYKSSGNFTNDDQDRLIDFLLAAHANNDLCSLSNRENAGIKTEQITTESINVGYFAPRFNDDWNVCYFDVKYTAGRHNLGLKGKEVLIKNY